MSEENSHDERSTKNGIRIRWEVPLPWLVGGLAIICIQAAFVYFGQIRQGEILTEQSVTIKELSRQLGTLNALITANNLKDVEHDLKLADHDRRIIALEATLARMSK